MSLIPHYSSTEIAGRNIFIDDSVDPQIDAVVCDSGNTDSGATPTTRLRPGNVLIKRTSTGRFVEANDTNGDALAAPAITSSGHSDGNGVIEIIGNHGTISVTTSTGSGTEANNVTDLNADQAFAASYLASSAGGELTITALNTGPDEWFYMGANTMATASFSEGETNAAQGTAPDVVVLVDYVDLEDEEGTAVHADATVARCGHFDESQLINLTAEAKSVLISRGARFG